jgi:hypothetical protein
MKKIVELLIDVEDFAYEGIVDVISLVNKPAIGIDWMAFSESNVDLQEFASYTDYPQSVSDAAQRGIDLNEAVENKCATLVGKQRAQQLAQGKPISEETIKRMYSYLSRAQVYYDENDTEACGTISFLLWGSYPALKWSEKKLKEIEEEKLLKLADQYGEIYDPEFDLILDMSKEEFSTLEDISKAITALDILGKRTKKDEPVQQRYRYAGPKDSNTRGFCRRMLSLNKLYTLKDLRAMETALSGFGATRQGANYSVLEFKSGVNCRHAWHSVHIANRDGRTVMMDKGPVTEFNILEEDLAEMTVTEARNAGQIARPSNDYWHMSKQNFQVISEDKQIVVGPAMVPSMLIPRIDEEGNEFAVYFSEETIRKISSQFLSKGYLHNTNVNHNGMVTQENTLLESWIVEDPATDKSKIYGYDLPKGSWVVSYKINNEDTWNSIKNGELNGWSIEGTFLERNKN